MYIWYMISQYYKIALCLALYTKLIDRDTLCRAASSPANVFNIQCVNTGLQALPTQQSKWKQTNVNICIIYSKWEQRLWYMLPYMVMLNLGTLVQCIVGHKVSIMYDTTPVTCLSLNSSPCLWNKVQFESTIRLSGKSTNAEHSAIVNLHRTGLPTNTTLRSRC